jgi:hypothetical protein
MARSNGELIAKARQMTQDAGRRPATVQEARELLGIVRSADAAAQSGGVGADAVGSSAGAELSGA